MPPNPYRNAGFAPGRSRPTADGGANNVQRSFASQFKETDPLFNTYEHLKGLPRGDSALQLLRKIASIVKPIMRKHNWHVQILAEFLPAEQNLLGLNIDHGHKICIRLRYHHNPDLFLPLDELVDTLLHELCHIIWGPHDSNFHRLWDTLRDEHETLQRKGYTGEGFLSAGHRLGGTGNTRVPPPSELRRLARASAEKRKAQGTLAAGSGRRLGGAPLHLRGDVRDVIAGQATRRNTINRGCASGRGDAGALSEQAASNTFRTKAEEDDANNRAIAEALMELMEQEEAEKLEGVLREPGLGNGGGGLAWDPQTGLYDATAGKESGHGAEREVLSEEEQLKWAMQESTRHATGTESTQEVISGPPIPLASKPEYIDSSYSAPAPPPQATHMVTAPSPVIDLTDVPEHDDPISSDGWTCEVCTCINPLQFLACDACGAERPQGLQTQKKQRPKTAPAKNPDRRYVEIPQPASKAHDSLGWNCGGCGAFMEHKWWTCSACGRMKDSS